MSIGYSLVQGNLEPDMLIPLAAPGAQAALATALQVQLQWQKPDGTIVIVALAVVNSGPGNPGYTVKRVWQAGDSDQVGVHRGRVQIVCANGELATDPNDGTWMIWNVYP